jgi:hypothetical protein
MTVEVLEEADAGERYRAACIVETTDATGATRRYRVSLTGDFIGGRYLLAGKRVDEHDHDRTPDAPSQAAYDAAREWFRAEGHAVDEVDPEVDSGVSA